MNEQGPESVLRFRQEYRASHIGPRYLGWGHFALTSTVSLLVVAACVMGVHDVRPLEWLVLPLGFLTANAAEYFGHRGPMHHRKRTLSLLFQRHTLEHHRFFTHEAMTYEGSRDFKMVLFPPVMLVFFLGGIAAPLGLLLGLSWSRNAGLLFAALGMAYFLTYEWLHFCYHLDEDTFLGRRGLIRALRRHHVHHHDPALMGRHNFNITFPLLDTVMGTRFKPPPPPPPKEHAVAERDR